MSIADRQVGFSSAADRRSLGPLLARQELSVLLSEHGPSVLRLALAPRPAHFPEQSVPQQKAVPQEAAPSHRRERHNLTPGK